MTPTRWLVTAGLTCLFGLIGATAFCIGCSLHEGNRLGQPENFATFLLAGGAYLSLILVIFSVAVFLVALGSLLLKQTWSDQTELSFKKAHLR
jgi:uncharacterized membrane protein